MSGSRTRWAAIGAAVAVTLGAGGLLTASAASEASVFVAIDPTRVLDTRIDAGLSGPLVNSTARKLDVTGTIPIVLPGDKLSTGAPVPDGATAIVANVTGISPSTVGFLAVRPGTATGSPASSNVNFTAPGVIVPNSVTVELPTTGAAAGTIDLYFFGTAPGATLDVAIDIVGYYQAGGAGTPGPKGDTGAKGDSGPRGFSAWDDIPSGQTVTGSVIWDESVIADNADARISVPFPGKANPPIASSANVNFAPDIRAETTDDDASCTGTLSDPTAPPGKVCLYLSNTGGADGLSGEPNFIDGSDGFYVNALSNGAPGVDMFVYLAWAYTAP